MPINELGGSHYTPQEEADLVAALTVIETIVLRHAPNFNDKERREYGSINEQNKLLANKVMDYYEASPQLASPDVDWVEFVADYKTRRITEKAMIRLNDILYLFGSIKISHDYDNYHAALDDYDYTKYKSRTKTAGFTEKAKALKDFFPHTGGNTNTTPAEPDPVDA